MAGNRLDFSFGVVCPCELDAVSCGLVMVTAADRAAATFAAWEQALYKKKALTFCQSLLLVYARTKRLPPQRALSAASLTEDNPHLARPRRLCQPPWTQPTRKEPRPRSGGTKPEATYPAQRQPLFGREGLGERRFSQRSGLSPRVSPTLTSHVRGGSVSRRGLNQLARNRAHAQAEPSQKQRTPPNASRSSGERGWGRGASLREAASPPESPQPSPRTSAAALSAAVDSTNSQGTAPTLRRNQARSNVLRRTPAALRERGSGGEALLSEKRPLPQSLPNPQSLREVARGRGFSIEKPPPPEFPTPSPYAHQ